MRCLLLLSAAALLLGCAPPDPYEQAQEEAREAVSARSIEGTYIVTYVDEEEPQIGISGHEPTVTISADRVHFQSQCIYENWAYSREGESIETGPWDYGGEPVAMCARGLAPGEEAIITAIGGADTVRFVPRGIWMSGDSGTVQMRWVPGEADLAGRDIDLSGSWVAQALDGRDLPAGIELEADWNGIWWEPDCAGQAVSYTIDGSKFDAPEPRNPGEVCDIGFPPELTDIWRALAAADMVELTENGGVLISGNGRDVLLAPREGAGH
ncbi:MAG: hypothetical protein WBA68_12485 [Alteraurantiacibacter sp.]